MFGAVAAADLSLSATKAAAAQASASDQWMTSVTGTHRCRRDDTLYYVGLLVT
jgi:hypothetical protein